MWSLGSAYTRQKCIFHNFHFAVCFEKYAFVSHFLDHSLLSTKILIFFFPNLRDGCRIYMKPLGNLSVENVWLFWISLIFIVYSSIWCSRNNFSALVVWFIEIFKLCSMSWPYFRIRSSMRLCIFRINWAGVFCCLNENVDDSARNYLMLRSFPYQATISFYDLLNILNFSHQQSLYD